MSAMKERGKTWTTVTVAAAVMLGLGLFGGVTLARMSGDHVGMMAGMHSMMMGGGMSGGDVSKMMADMEGMMAAMHPDLPAEKRAKLLEKCRSMMASMGRQHHDSQAAQGKE